MIGTPGETAGRAKAGVRSCEEILFSSWAEATDGVPSEVSLEGKRSAGHRFVYFPLR